MSKNGIKIFLSKFEWSKKIMDYALHSKKIFTLVIKLCQQNCSQNQSISYQEESGMLKGRTENEIYKTLKSRKWLTQTNNASK